MSESKKYIQLADHLIVMTYPLVKSPKILKLAMNNLYIGLRHLMKEITDEETEEFSELIIKSKEIFEKKGVNKKFIDYLWEIQMLIKEQKESEIEFERKNKYVFASSSYKMQILNEKEVKDYILKAKLLMNLVM